MPKTGMQPIRMAGLVEAAIDEIGLSGTLGVTVGQIAKRAGVSSALAHHYFGTKDQIFLSAMRHILSGYGAEVRQRLAVARTPRERLDAVVSSGFDEQNFRPAVVGAWLNLYIRAQTSPEIARLLRVYRRRLRSNLIHELRALSVPSVEARAEGIGAMIDGVYLRRGLAKQLDDPAEDAAILADYVEMMVGHRQ